MYIHTYVRIYSCNVYSSTECIQLITETSETQSTTNTVTSITTANITHTTTNRTVTTTSGIVTSSSVSITTPTAVASAQNSSGMYICIYYVCTYICG